MSDCLVRVAVIRSLQPSVWADRLLETVGFSSAATNPTIAEEYNEVKGNTA